MQTDLHRRMPYPVISFGMSDSDVIYKTRDIRSHRMLKLWRMVKLRF
jgi:hypothetical protein